jgi:DNA mismatch repair protein PMS2
MQVVGQFNKGFMIANLDDADLYIIDQHASDEKYNFETLQATTQMKSQRLFQPRSMDLTASEELVVMDHLLIFNQNGFEVKVSPENEPTKRIQLVSVAQSKNTMFDHHGNQVDAGSVVLFF